MNSGPKSILRWIGPAGRIGIASVLVLGFIVGFNSWGIAGLMQIERELYSYRSVSSVIPAQSEERITLVPITVGSLGQKGVPPSDQQIRSSMPSILTALQTLRPKSISVVFPYTYELSSDAEFIRSLNNSEVPVGISFYPQRFHPEFVEEWQEKYQVGLLRRITNPNVNHNDVRIREDSDGVVRNWPLLQQGMPPLLANSVADESEPLANYSGPIQFRQSSDQSVSVFTSIPADLIVQFANAKGQEFDAEVEGLLKGAVEGRHVIIGRNINATDRVITPVSEQSGNHIPTLELYAHMLAQRISGEKLGVIPAWVFVLLSGILVAAGATTAFSNLNRTKKAMISLMQISLIAALPFLIQWTTRNSYAVPALGAFIAWTAGFYAITLMKSAVRWQQGHMAETALHRYLPQDVATDILEAPGGLDKVGERQSIFVMFSDLEGFTKLCTSLPASKVAFLLNDYLETLSQVVVDHGGTVDKFVGDAVVALWGAPTSSPDDGERAVAAAIAVNRAGEEFRQKYAMEDIRVGQTRVGLHYGEAIVGNFGGRGRIQYTALGDTINVASRLEAANKELGTSVLISKQAAMFSPHTPFRNLGSILVRGRRSSIEVFDPLSSLAKNDLLEFNDLVERASDGDGQAVIRLEEQSIKYSDDAPLGLLIQRLKAGQLFKGANETIS